MAKQKLERFCTPAGIAVYPHLNRPDTKFNADGEFKVKLRLPADDAQPMIEKIDAAMEQSFADAKAGEKNAAKRKKIKRADPPYSPTYDEEGNETGDIEISFKLRHRVTPRKGDPFTQRPVLFDAKGKPMDENIYGGSRIKVAGEIFPFNSPTVGAGVSLRLKAVQVLELVSSSGADASAYGFEEEDGYESNGFDGDEDSDQDEDTTEGEEGDEDEDEF